MEAANASRAQNVTFPFKQPSSRTLTLSKIVFHFWELRSRNGNFFLPYCV